MEQLDGMPKTVREEISTKLRLKSQSNYYTANIESSEFTLIRGSLVFNNMSLIPKQAAIDSLIKNESKKNALETITISSVKFKGIGLINVLLNNKININTIEINDLHVKLLLLWL